MPTLTALAATKASKWPSDGGYTEGDVRLVLGENWLRMMRQIWK